MSDAEELTAIAEDVAEINPDLAFRLRAVAARVRRGERALDEIAEQGRLDAQVANAIAVEHLSKYKARERR
jgi:hypothetical protein